MRPCLCLHPMYSNETDETNTIGVKIRRNSTVLPPSEKEKVYENQQSDYKSRRYVIYLKLHAYCHYE